MHCSSSLFGSRLVTRSGISIGLTLPSICCLVREIHSFQVPFFRHRRCRHLGHAQTNALVKRPLPRLCSKEASLSHQLMGIHVTIEQNKNTSKGGLMTPLEDESIEQWTHPDKREERNILQDPELKDLLRELAADFGEGDSSVGKRETDLIVDDDLAVAFEGDTVVKKEEVIKDQSKNDVDTISKKKRNLLPVFDVDSITDLLREENASDVCVIKVPQERQYVDYFIVVTARSTRHLHAMTQSINKTYKQKKSNKHTFVFVEGKTADDWMCLDFGNIVVHFMTEDVRDLYELEKLWLLGPEYDDHMERIKKYQESVKQAMAVPSDENIQQDEMELGVDDSTKR